MSALALALDTVERRIRTLPLDGGAPELALDGFREAFGASLWAAHRLQRFGPAWAPAFIEHAGWTSAGLRSYVDMISTPTPELPFLYDPERPPSSQQNRVFALSELRETAPPSSAMNARRVLTKIGLEREDQLRVIVCDGGELLGWVGGFRARPFTPVEKRAFGRLLPSLRTALLWRRRLVDAHLTRASLETAMNAIGCPAFLVRGRGAIAHANDIGRCLVAKKGHDVHSELEDALASGRAEALEVRGVGVAAHELVILREGYGRFERLLARATEAWSLTRRQRDVLARVACGDSNKSIATKLGCTEATVEVHVTALLRKARASGRGQLIARLWAGELTPS